MSVNLSGYKAAVCIFLYGGNSSYNWIIPVTAAKYAEYAAARGALAIPAASVLPLNGTASDGNAYGIHPSCPEIQALFNAGKAAVVANVGTLVAPTTPAEVASAGTALPAQLFSHINQQQEWMEGYAQGNYPTGWGGRIADQLVAAGYTPKLDTAITAGAGGNQESWTIGAATSTYVLGAAGATPIKAVTNGGALATALGALYAQSATDPNLLVQAFGAVADSAMSKLGIVQAALTAAGSFKTATFSTDDFGNQLAVVAKLIKAQATLGDARQLFFIGMNGFDTHTGELATQATLLAELSAQINQFHNAMVEAGTNEDVVLFTNSEFARTLLPNNGGSDHAWGGHAMVFGDPVKTGFFGTMPSLVIGGADDVGEGRICPTTSSDQMHATIANWIGADPTQLAAMFPNLANFAPSGAPITEALLGFL